MKSPKKILPVREKYDHEGIFPWDVVKACGEADLCGLYIPEQYGGFGGGVFELCLAVEELSKVCGGISLAMAATALEAFPILLFASDEQKKKYLPDIAAGKKLAAFGLTEANAGSDALSMKTTAVKDGDHYVLNGTKQWITNGERRGDLYDDRQNQSRQRRTGPERVYRREGRAGIYFR